jgi:hypothetical protein
MDGLPADGRRSSVIMRLSLQGAVQIIRDHWDAPVRDQ